MLMSLGENKPKCLNIIAKIEYWYLYLKVFSLFNGVWRHFQQYIIYISVKMMLLQPCTLMEEEEDIVAVSFIGGGNRKTRRKPPICRKSLTNFIT